MCTLVLKNGLNTSGYDGGGRWVLTGTLLAGEKGFVKYRSKNRIDNVVYIYINSRC